MMKRIIHAFKSLRSVEKSLGIDPYDSPPMTEIKHELLAIALKTDSDVILISADKRQIVQTLAELSTENIPGGYDGRIFGKYIKFVEEE